MPENYAHSYFSLLFVIKKNGNKVLNQIVNVDVESLSVAPNTTKTTSCDVFHSLHN